MFNVKLKPAVLAVAGVLAATSVYAADEAIKAGKVEVVSATPLAGIGLSPDKIPANIQVVNGNKMTEQGSLTIADFMNSNMQGISVVETQGNPFQPDVTFHGFNANALLGSPQGLSIYQDGVRINEPFGDVVSWDLVPMNSIKQMQLIPGTNPLYGLNSLGGSISLQTKRGRDVKGGAVEVSGGSWGRKNTQFEYGNVGPNGIDFFVAGNYFDEDGWRDSSPSTVRQLFGQLGWQDEKTDLNLTVSLADNELTGNGLLPSDMMRNLGNSSVYTKPDQTKNKMAFITLSGSRWLSDNSMVSGNAYYRNVRTSTFNGDLNGNVAEQGILAVDNVTSRGGNGVLTAQQLFAAACQAGTNSTLLFDGKSATAPPETVTVSSTTYTVLPYDSALTGYSSATTIGSDTFYKRTVSGTDYYYSKRLLAANQEPSSLCNSALNTSKTTKNGAGTTVQYSYNAPLVDHNNQLTVGLSYDYSDIKFTQGSQYGILNQDRSITAVPYFSEEKTDLKGETNTWSVFATDTFSISPKVHLTASGRYNTVNVDNYDNLVAAGDIKSLTARHNFQRFNPAVGLTFLPADNVMTYASYNEGSRAPTSMELGCANPEAACKLPNAMAGDPPLKQVVTRTFDVGAKGKLTNDLAWSLTAYRSENDNDIQFMRDTSSSALGYFSNIGTTRREGVDLGLSGKFGKFSWLTSYSYIHATYQDSFQADVANNKDKSKVAPGDRIPGIPAHQIKLRGSYQATPSWNLGVNVVAFSSQYLQGNENNGYYASTASSSFTSNYYDNGKAPGYAVVNLDTRYNVGDTGWQIFAKINNVFDRNYVTGGLQGASMFNPATNGYVGDDHRVSMFAPGSPRAAWVGIRYEFGGAKSLLDNN